MSRKSQRWPNCPLCCAVGVIEFCNRIVFHPAVNVEIEFREYRRCNTYFHPAPHPSISLFHSHISILGNSSGAPSVGVIP